MRLLAYAVAAVVALSPSELLAAGAPVSGRVVDNAGHSVAGALVALVELHRATTTDRDGAFRFGDVPAGRYTVSARHIGLISAAKPIAVETSPVTVSLVLDERPTLAHSIADLPGVRNASTGQEIGKPMIRGLFGPRILVLTDGSRLEDYSWSDEDGPSLDARIADRIEVMRGPASVLYGSEAAGTW